jgi:hypothetical protein
MPESDLDLKFPESPPLGGSQNPLRNMPALDFSGEPEVTAQQAGLGSSCYGEKPEAVLLAKTELQFHWLPWDKQRLNP